MAPTPIRLLGQSALGTGLGIPLNESPADLIQSFPANKWFHGTEQTDIPPLSGQSRNIYSTLRLSAGELFQGLLTLVSVCSQRTMFLQDCIANLATYVVLGVNRSLTDLSHNLRSAMLPECRQRNVVPKVPNSFCSVVLCKQILLEQRTDCSPLKDVRLIPLFAHGKIMVLPGSCSSQIEVSGSIHCSSTSSKIPCLVMMLTTSLDASGLITFAL